MHSTSLKNIIEFSHLKKSNYIKIIAFKVLGYQLWTQVIAFNFFWQVEDILIEREITFKYIFSRKFIYSETLPYDYS
jgi:hypothetical protein